MGIGRVLLLVGDVTNMVVPSIWYMIFLYLENLAN